MGSATGLVGIAMFSKAIKVKETSFSLMYKALRRRKSLARTRALTCIYQ